MIIQLNYQPSGGKTWVAKITGRDPKFTFERQFLPIVDRDISSSGKTGLVSFEITEGNYYEVCAAWKSRYFVDGQNNRVSAEDVLAFLDSPKAV
jgi:hypothetical protein